MKQILRTYVELKMKKVKKKFELDLSTYHVKINSNPYSEKKPKLVSNSFNELIQDDTINNDTIVIKKFWLQDGRKCRTS